jgi:hypothetical protein
MKVEVEVKVPSYKVEVGIDILRVARDSYRPPPGCWIERQDDG